MPKALPRPALWTGAVLAASSAAILIAAPAQYLGRQQDDLLYLIGANSLLEGKFRLLTVPGQPPLYMINPGFPALLSPLAWFAGENYGLYQAFCAALLASAPWLIWLWLKPRLDRTLSLLVCALFSLSPLILCQAGTIMSEGPFLLAALALLLALDKPVRGKAAAWWLFAATQLRTAALPLLPAALARPFSKRRWKECLLLCAPAAAGMFAWSLWSRAASGSAQQKLEELGVAYASGVSRIPAVAYDNALYYLSSCGASVLPASWGAGPAATLMGALLLAAALAGAVRLWRKDPFEPALWLLAGTGALHLVWPWHYERYLIMPLPFLLWCLAEGLGRRARPALIAFLLCQTIFQARPWLTHDHGWQRPELSRTYSWVRSHTGAPDIIASVMYLRDGFLTARPALPLPASRDAYALYGVLKSRQVKFVLWQDDLDLGLTLDASSVVRGQLDRDAAGLSDRTLFRIVYEDPEEHARVYELL